MTKPPLLMLIPVVIFAGFAGLFLAGMFREAPGEVPSTMIGHVAPRLLKKWCQIRTFWSWTTSPRAK